MESKTKSESTGVRDAHTARALGQNVEAKEKTEETVVDNAHSFHTRQTDFIYSTVGIKRTVRACSERQKFHLVAVAVRSA
jgi:hypothetical protein